ncbi:hypothetical protein DPMN_173440 [Dreissena polymorpha]|uniref:Uncharacterized protein n=1 Tax=Dreissena polymorpha TaxID=45954 RepID=A0A9D4E440_DREPO|nr:hypothetical protein DPMN_173440 [Dreissena polymorpha]
MCFLVRSLILDVPFSFRLQRQTRDDGARHPAESFEYHLPALGACGTQVQRLQSRKQNGLKLPLYV